MIFEAIVVVIFLALFLYLRCYLGKRSIVVVNNLGVVLFDESCLQYANYHSYCDNQNRCDKLG